MQDTIATHQLLVKAEVPIGRNRAVQFVMDHRHQIIFRARRWTDVLDWCLYMGYRDIVVETTTARYRCQLEKLPAEQE